VDEKMKKAFDFAQETTKQLLTLATGIIALTITFLKDVVHEAPPGAAKYIEIAWFLYLVSVLFGMATLMGLTGSLVPKTGAPVREPSIYAWAVRIPSSLQILTFVAALVLTLIFGLKAT
jgi:uncharacterized membrane protein